MKTWWQKLWGAGRPPSGPREMGFREMAGRYLERMEKWGRLPQGDGECVGVLVVPWMVTAVPFFALELGRRLAERGKRVVLLFDFSDLVENVEGIERQELRRVMAAAGSWAEVREIEGGGGVLGGEAGGDLMEVGEKLARANAIRIMRGEQEAGDFHRRRPEAAGLIEGHWRRLVKILPGLGLERLVVPGGVYGVSGSYVAAARALGLPFQTFDSGPGILRLCQNGVAAHLGDIPRAFAWLLERVREDEELAGRLVRLVEEELEDRQLCRDFRQFQAARAGGDVGEASCEVLVPLNVSWDSAALQLEGAFGSGREWLEAVARWAGRNPQWRVCVRQHPRERLAHLRSRDDVGEFLRLVGGEGLRYVAAADPVNTYDLMAGAKVVLPYSSTVGIEAVLLGKQVVVGTGCYYAGMGFVHRAETPEEYFAAVEAALKGEREGGDYLAAAVAYFLTQRCGYIRTEFTPMPEAFAKWVEWSGVRLWGEEVLVDYERALVEQTELAKVRAERILAMG